MAMVLVEALGEHMEVSLVMVVVGEGIVMDMAMGEVTEGVVMVEQAMEGKA